ncbi:MAG: DUF2141 domain-containing protein [Sphingobacteriales bacterium]|nr:MAG: DUF2141 domain-containing protein [Sphingobacteriales bacterium]
MRNYFGSKRLIFFILSAFLIQQILLQSSCAHIIPPTGGDKDTLPPVPVKSSPKDSVLHYNGNKITIEFNEFIELDKPFENVILSPNPTKQPVVESRLKTLTVRLKDSLLPNTTYSIDFGNAIKDINEGNILKDYKFVFSTGSTIDTKELSGKVILAENGKIDSTLIVTLYKNTDDSAVAKKKPFYYTRLKGDGSFRFSNLPAGKFALYALKDANGNKQYDSPTEMFAFAGNIIETTDSTAPVTLYAYAEEKEKPKPASGTVKTEKRLVYANNLENRHQSLIEPFTLTFLKPLKYFDSTKISFLDSTHRPVTGYQWIKDSSNKKLTLRYQWQPGMVYQLILQKAFAADTMGYQLSKIDTLNFSAKKPEEYGSLRLKFTNFDKSKNPVLQFVLQDKVVKSVVITDAVWSEKLVNPGDYELRVLYDDNKNGIWDPGKFFGVHKQPEKVVPVAAKLTIKANWENENIVDLKQ